MSEQIAATPSPPLQQDYGYTSSRGFMIFLLLFFPPLALSFMYKQKRYHSWLPLLIWIYAIPFLLIFLQTAFFVAPQLKPLSETLGNPTLPLFVTQILLCFVIGLLLVEIFIGILIRKKAKQTSGLSQKTLRLTVLVIFLTYVTCAVGTIIVIQNVLNPIYAVTSSY